MIEIVVKNDGCNVVLGVEIIYFIVFLKFQVILNDFWVAWGSWLIMWFVIEVVVWNGIEMVFIELFEFLVKWMFVFYFFLGVF